MATSYYTIRQLRPPEENWDNLGNHYVLDQGKDTYGPRGKLKPYKSVIPFTVWRRGDDGGGRMIARLQEHWSVPRSYLPRCGRNKSASCAVPQHLRLMQS